LIGISPAGKRLFARIRRRESAIIEQVFRDIPGQDLQATRRTLQTLVKNLDTGGNP
jgi:hypothetical protein